jgi:hypothetical protein
MAEVSGLLEVMTSQEFGAPWTQHPADVEGGSPTLPIWQQKYMSANH